jgi:hypothetical protein
LLDDIFKKIIWKLLEEIIRIYKHINRLVTPSVILSTDMAPGVNLGTAPA